MSAIDKINRIRKHAYAYALHRGLKPETSEEFASYCVIRFLENGKLNKTQLEFCDFVRKEKGRTGTERSKIELLSIDEFKNLSLEQFDSLQELIPNGLGKLFIFLRVEYGIHQKDIASMIGTTESRVSQIISSSLKEAGLIIKKTCKDKKTNQSCIDDEKTNP